MQKPPIEADAITGSRGKTGYPRPFSALFQGRNKKKLGVFFGLRNFGVNVTRLVPGAISALKHYHSHQDEFIFVLEGKLLLVLGDQEYVMVAGDCVGFPAGAEVGHQLVNRFEQDGVYIEVGDRSQGDEVEYPDDDIKAFFEAGDYWVFTHKDGSAFNSG